MSDFTEFRKCNDCCEEWIDGGEQECPFCKSVEVEIVIDEEEL